VRIIVPAEEVRSMSVTYVIKFQVVPDKYDAFLALLNGVLDAMRHEATFVEAMLHADPDDANRLMLYETWESHDDVVNVQLHRPYRCAFHEALAAMLTVPRDISIWRCQRADRSAKSVQIRGTAADQTPSPTG
jgi:autoinducer 2-degrading protein